jgi:glycosyltransferase involved in cell wall biosynthesis
MRYLFLTKSADDPATRYRVDPIVNALRQRGDTVDLVPEATTAQQLSCLVHASRYDLVFVQRKLFSSAIARLLGVRARRLVFDCDDAIFLRSSGKPSTTRRARYSAITRAADLVLCGNSYLCEMARQEGAAAELVPTSVDTARYAPRSKPETPVSLVWIGSRSTSRYLEEYRSILEAVGAAIPGLELRIISNFELTFDNLAVISVPWSEATEAEALAMSHIGIAPMSDDPWTRGKCALKVIQYMAAGLPVVSSDVGANSDVIVDGVTGILADTEDDWIWAVRQLVESAGLRQDMGAAGRQQAESRYSMAACVQQVTALLDQLTNQ